MATLLLVNEQNTTSNAAVAGMTVEVHNDHLASNYICDGMLKPECVNVRLARSEAGIYDVEISALDRDYCFEIESRFNFSSACELASLEPTSSYL